jgi:acyl carrier protein
MIMEELILELKEQIIKALNLEEMTPEDIETDAPLFGEGLGLDSIDALELIVLLEKKYGIKLANPAEGKAIFTSVATIADFVSKNRKK